MLKIKYVNKGKLLRNRLKIENVKVEYIKVEIKG